MKFVGMLMPIKSFRPMSRKLLSTIFSAKGPLSAVCCLMDIHRAHPDGVICRLACCHSTVPYAMFADIESEDLLKKKSDESRSASAAVIYHPAYRYTSKRAQLVPFNF